MSPKQKIWYEYELKVKDQWIKDGEDNKSSKNNRRILTSKCNFINDLCIRYKPTDAKIANGVNRMILN